MLVEVENKKSRGVNIQAMKDRNYRMVELIRQVNAREQKRLERNTLGINANCRYQLDQVSFFFNVIMWYNSVFKFIYSLDK